VISEGFKPTQMCAAEGVETRQLGPILQVNIVPKVTHTNVLIPEILTHGGTNEIKGLR
jgi:hypothetical protein